MSDPTRLPASFKSLYRLFLRTASASVMHHSRASRNLRRRWRSSFDEAAQVTRELQQEPSSESRSEWLKTWHNRMDNTLELLYTASHTRGIPHLVTRSLAFAIEDTRRLAIEKLALRKEWQPANPEYLNQTQKAVEKKKRHEKLQEQSLGALDEIVKMAGASGNLILGPNTTCIEPFRAFLPPLLENLDPKASTTTTTNHPPSPVQSKAFMYHFFNLTDFVGSLESCYRSSKAAIDKVS